MRSLAMVVVCKDRRAEDCPPTIPPSEFENRAFIALGGIPNKVQVGDMRF